MNKELYIENNFVCKVYIADTFLKRFFGYMARKGPHHDAILITPCNSIHTFFMRFDIDVLFVDDDCRVIRKVEGLKPGKMVMPVHGTSFVIETQAGGFDACGTGQRITLKAVDS